MRSFLIISVIALTISSSIINKKFIEHLKKVAPFEVYSQEENPFRDWTQEEIKSMLGTIISEDNTPKQEEFKLNDAYDFRTEHPECMLGIRDQAQCGSCWAFGAVMTLQERFCLKSGGEFKKVLAPQDPISCDFDDMGCNGGWLKNVWGYFRYTGVVDEECNPYVSGDGHVPDCPFYCVNGEPIRKKYKTKSTKSFTNQATIISEIPVNGPIEAGFDVYADFMNYKGGIYEHVSGDLQGGHAVVILGYGTEGDKNYWICQNSWGEAWGEAGYFRIKFGECGIEKGCYAGEPSL